MKIEILAYRYTMKHSDLFSYTKKNVHCTHLNTSYIDEAVVVVIVW